MSRRTREGADFSLSFMDIICCGFGAVVLLLVITKIAENDIPAEILAALQTQLSQVKTAYNIASDDLTREQAEQQTLDKQSQIQRVQFNQLKEALRELQAKLVQLAQHKAHLNSQLGSQVAKTSLDESKTVAGVPLDGEHIMFVVDTSGSMKSHAWESMLKIMEQILDVYPQVQGLQVMSDMGEYLYSSYRGEWMSDKPRRRELVLKHLRGWNTHSNSSPVEGIEEAIRTYRNKYSNIAIYVLGDEFSGESIERVLDTVDNLNRQGRPGDKPIRIHAVGFPVLFKVGTDGVHTGIRFATLMRELTLRNRGAFIGITEPP